MVPQQANAGTAPTGLDEKAHKQAEEGKPGLDETKTLAVVNHSPSQANAKDAPELLTNEIIVNKGEK